jgi:DNA polymerase elongation subunit (family B)
MITIESKGKDIILFGRDANNIAYVQKIEDFYPYFYVEDENGEFNTIDGKKAKKIECKDPKEVRELRDNYKKTYEADIRFVNRYIIDRVQEIPKEKVRLCYLDIESQKTEKGYEDPFLGVNPILSIVVYDNFLEEYKTFCVGETHSTERQMLIEFSKYIQERNPDMFVAWNGDGYDFPMLVNRLRYLKLNPDALCRSGGKAYSKDEDTHIYGRICFDLMKGYKKIAQGGRESWSLDYISKYEGMGGKEVYTGDLDDLYKTDIKKFMSYNKRDVELMVLIDGKLNIISFFDEMRRLCFSRFEDVFMSSKLADCLCLKFAQNKYVLPSGNKSEETDKYPGAFVHASEPKLHRNVAVMDFKSLYPSIMIGFNTSYETIIPEKTENCINAFDKFYYKKEQGMQ